jgi:ankyrin repeat protein
MSHQDDLMQAAREGNIEKINLAISSGAKVNLPDKMGTTALFKAAKYGHAEVVRALYHQHKGSI